MFSAEEIAMAEDLQHRHTEIRHENSIEQQQI
jgi:hypothetical protein